MFNRLRNHPSTEQARALLAARIAPKPLATPHATPHVTVPALPAVEVPPVPPLFTDHVWHADGFPHWPFTVRVPHGKDPLDVIVARWSIHRGSVVLVGVR